MVSNSLIPALYLVFFAVLHSLLASLRAKAVARSMMGERVDPWYMIFFVAAAVIAVLPLIYLLYLYPGKILYVVPPPWRWLMVAGQLLVALGSTKAFIDAPHRFLIMAQLSEPKRPESRHLALRGVYCHVRDPFLLSGLIIIWLTPFMTDSLLAVYLLTTVYLFLGSLHWERRLVAQFGDSYRQYQKQVPRLIPRRGRCFPSNA